MTSGWKRWMCLVWLCLISFSGNAVTPMINAANQASIFLNGDGSVWGTGSVTNYSPGATSPVRLLSLPNVVAVAAGLGDYALLGDGTVWASGSFNNYGQLGDGTTQPHSDPRQVPGLFNVTAIKAGGHVLALKADSTVWAWGLNAQGQLGDGTRIDRYSPVEVAGLSDVMRISASTVSSLALKSDGTVWEWGLSVFDSEGSHLVPSPVPNLDRVITISAGSGNNMALRADGTVWAWGANDSGQIGDGSFVPRPLPVQIPGLSDVVAIEARGMSFSIALKADGSVWAWGNNNQGQLGVSGLTYGTTPIRVPGLSDIVTIAAGYSHVLAMRRDGAVFAWGDNMHGQIGDGTLQNRAEPRPVLGPGGSGQLNLVQPAPANPNQLPSAQIDVNPPSGRAPLSVNFAARNVNDPDGSVTAYYWQASDAQQATGPSATFVFSLAGTYTVTLLVEDNSGGRGIASALVVVTQPPGTTSSNPNVAIRQGNGVALANDGRILSWGYDGGLGRPQLGVFGHMIPVPSANGITGAVDIAIAGGGIGTKFVLLADGGVLGWGANDKGQLGVGSQQAVSSAPQSLRNLPPVQALTAGVEHVLALTRDGKVFAWGRNAEGQLGLGDNANRFSPIEIPGLSNVIAIAAGFNFSMALTADGTVWAWGENTSSQLGDGTQLSHNRPIQVPGLANVQRIFATMGNGVAVDADGAVWASGYLPFSFAGDVHPPSVFRRVPLLDGAVQLAGGGQHIIFRKADGTVWVVGTRGSLALGVEGTGDIQVPQQLPGITDAIWVAASANNSMVLRGDGTVLAWGRNGSGELGDGTLAYRATPVLVVNETASGFLDLIPEVTNTVPPDWIPPFLVATYSSGDLSSTSLYTDLRGITASGTFASATGDGDRSAARFAAAGYNVYVAANVPTLAASSYFQLDANNNWSAFRWPMSEFLRGVALDSQTSVVRAQILQNADLSSPQLVGASILVGYGTDPDEMVRAARYRTIFTVTQP